jgi:hypothetical protein
MAVAGFVVLLAHGANMVTPTGVRPAIYRREIVIAAAGSTTAPVRANRSFAKLVRQVQEMGALFLELSQRHPPPNPPIKFLSSTLDPKMEQR